MNDHQAICHIDEEKLVILVCEIGYRKEIYD